MTFPHALTYSQCTRRRKKMDHLSHSFHQECALARAKGDKISNGDRGIRFLHILNAHAMVMIDGALPHLEKSKYVNVGKRLGKVQEKWIGLLCICLPAKGEETNAQYTETITRVIENFSDNLTEMLMEQKQIPYESLAADQIFLHSRLSAVGERNLARTQVLFHNYIDTLCRLYDSDTQVAYKTASLHCLAGAQALGAWLDHTI